MKNSHSVVVTNLTKEKNIKSKFFPSMMTQQLMNRMARHSLHL